MSEINYFNTDPKFIKAKYFRKGRNGVEPNLIVIHTMESPEKGSTAENVGHYFQQPSNPASTHYGVDTDSVVQYVYDSNTAYGCKNANSNGVHIEHAGYADQKAIDWQDENSQKILRMSAQIAAYLCRKFDIPVQRAVFASKTDPKVIKKGFCGHADVPLHGSHYDPGKEFPWEQYFGYVNEVLSANPE